MKFVIFLLRPDSINIEKIEGLLNSSNVTPPTLKQIDGISAGKQLTPVL